MKKAFHIANALRMTAFLTRVIMLPLLLCLSADAQQLELASTSASIVATGPLATATSTFLQNTGTSATFSAFTPTTTFTVAFSNQQYTSSTYPGLTIGGFTNGTTTTLAPANLFVAENNYSSPVPNSNLYTSAPDIATAGTNHSVSANYGNRLYVDPYYLLGQPLSGRFYYGDMTVTFNRPVTSPVLHFTDIGGALGNGVGAVQGFWSEFELTTAGLTLTKLSGSTHFVLDVSNKQILNNSTYNGTTTATYASPTAEGGYGSVLVNTGASSITSITFKVYLRGSGGSSASATWGYAPLGRAGETVTLGASLGLTTISGTVFGDGNGLTDGIVNGTGTNAGGALFANLVDASNNIIASSAVAANGTYSFVTADYINGNYKVILTTSAIATTAALPTGYQNMGENLGAGSGSDGLPNGILSISVTNLVNLANVNFGINKPPTANNVSGGSQTNPGSTTQVTAPTLTGSDAEDGTYTGVSNTNDIIIQSLPSNGILYYNGVAVTAGQSITNYNPTLLKVDPNDNITSLTFTYSEVDAAGFVSPAATVTMFAQTNCTTVQLGTVSVGGVINSYFLPATATVNAGATSLGIAAGTAMGASGSIAAGDLLLIIQMQDGASTDFTTAATYGTVSSTRAGQYEYVIATNVVTQAAGGTLNFESVNGGGLTYQYIQNAANAAGRQTYQLVKVPNYENVILTSTITGTNWDGTRGGIAALKVAGNTDFNTNFGINVSALGFRGAAGTAVSGANSGNQFRDASTLNTGAAKGEGISGVPNVVIPTPPNGTNPLATGTNYPNGSFMTGSPGNGGGGSKDTGPNAGTCGYGPNTSDYNGGGGGGSNAGTGGHGGFNWCTGLALYGLGGKSLSSFSDRMFMGGGGGAGEAQNNTRSFGGYGGGLVFFYTKSVTNTGANTSITANGEDNNRYTQFTMKLNSITDAAGGGGGGGSIYAYASSGLGALKLSANGSVGGNSYHAGAAPITNVSPTASPNNEHGPGGGGGGGKIFNSTTTGTVTVAGGAAGHYLLRRTDLGTNSDFGTFGATDGAVGVIVTAAAPSLATSCLDFGDAPVSYSTLVANTGAKHALTSPVTATTLYLGTARADQEDDGQPNVTATGDGADEDGIATLANYNGTGTYTATIAANNGTGSAANLYAWFDANSNGVFEAGEIFTTTVATGATSTVATWTGLPTTGLPAYTYLRVRLTSDALADNGGTPAIDERSTGNASNGEVEDYQVLMNPVTISGTIYNDANGLSNSIVDGVGTNASASLYAVLYDNTMGLVAGVMAVPASGVYSFTNAAGDNYTIYLTTNIPVVGQAAVPPVTLPATWVNTGENIGAGAGNDGTVNGILPIGVANANVTNANFGIDQQPVAGAGVNTTVNTGIGTQITVPANTFTNITASSDPSPGTVSAIKITAFPTGASSIVINGTSYTSGTFPVSGATVPADASGNPTQTITVSPTANGVTSVSIPFAAVDAAGVVSSNTGTAVLNLTSVSIAGNVYNDSNGLTDGIVNGTGTNGGGLNAVLVDAVTGNVVATTAVAAGGTYTFAGQNGGNYNVLITTSTAIVGSAAPAVLLPGAYLNSGENLGAAAGSDGTVNGILPLGSVAADVTNANFGITTAGFIYFHKKTLDEASSVDFTFNVTGGTTPVPAITLNDNPTQIVLRDIGSSQNGRLWAVGFNNNTLYYRDLGSSAWIATTMTNASRVDGGPSNTCVVVTTTGLVISFDGTTSASLSTATTSYGGSNASDVGSAWNSQPYITTAAGAIWQYSGAGTLWTQVGITTNNARIDGNPVNGNAIVSKTDNNIYSVTSAGVSTSLGKPSNSTGNATDVAVTVSGRIFSSYISFAVASGNKYAYEWTSGTTWTTEELTSRAYAETLTGGVGNQVWGCIPTSGLAGNIYTRTFDGTSALWLNDERVRTGPTGNSDMIAVVPGTYTITETVPSGWDLQHLYAYDPTGNSSTNLVGNTATLTIAAGETVTALFENGIVNPFAMTNSCSTAYLEDFGTGAVNTYGPALTGQTAYHYISGTTSGAVADYYKVIGNSSNLFTGSANMNDHTSGNGQGRMMAIDANNEPDAFFRRRFTGVVSGATYNFSAYIANINSGAIIKPNVTFEVVDPVNYNVLQSYSTGTITSNAVWTKYEFSFTATSTTIDLVIRNNGLGGSGNDLALDDITFTMVPPTTPVTSVTNTSCAVATGSITVTSPIGASYEYSNDGTNWQVSPSFTSLPIGIYTISARFAGTTGCVSSKIDTVKATICGTVFNDINGLSNSIVDGIGTNAGGINAVMYNNTTGKVDAVIVVPASGIYSYNPTYNNNYTIYLTTASPAINSVAIPTITLPAGYASTGENIGAGAGNDGTVNSILPLGVITTSITNANFGIEQNPTAGAGTQTADNPGGTNNLTVNATAFTSTTASSDVVPGAVTAILITAIPTGATTITINGTTYGPGFTAFPAAGVTVPANGSGQPTQAIAVDPTANGATSVTIPFRAVDAAGITSTNIGNAVITISDLVLSGSVFNDPNGVTNSLIDGTLITTAGTQLYVNLVNPTSGLVVGTSTVAAGLYSFGNANGLQANTNYNVVVSTVQGVVGTATGATSTLPAPWVNTAEGSGVGDGTVDGILAVSMGTADITTNANFGIESRPIVGAGSNTAVNPGNTTQVTVPANTFGNGTLSSDATLVTAIRITAFPTATATSIVINGVSYTSATFPAAGVTIPVTAGLPTQTITVDPILPGVTSVTLPFVAVDAAGKESAASGNAVMNFTAVTISGNVFNDVNGLNGGNTIGGVLVNGTDIDAGTAGSQALYASLVSGGVVLATVPVNASGAYTFPDVATGSYNVVLTSNAAGSTTASLPTDGQGWRNVGEFIGAGAGNDGTVNGILPVTMAGVSIANANFGIEQPPTAGGGSQTVALTPAGTTQTTVNNTTFTNTASSTDPSPGAVTSIRITAFPSGATTIVINSISYTSATFPVAGVVVPASAAGAPSQTITVDPAALVAIPTTVTIPFRAIDAAGVESANIGNAIINYGGALSISGSVYNDVNGLNGTPANVVNGTLVNGTDIDASAAGAQTLYATLVSLGLPVATVPVSSAGNYIFEGVTGILSYSVVLHTTSTGSTTAALPSAGSGWVNTGENVGLAAGNDGTPDGIINLGTVTTNITNANFGIEQPPAAGAGSNTAVNPGGTTQVSVPANTFTNITASSDPTPGSISGIKITAFPTGASSVVVNGTTYNSGVTAEVTALLALTIPTDASGNPTQTITVDPTAAAGVTSVVINFKAVDAAGVVSTNTGTATLNLTGMSVSGTIYNDADGLTNSTVDGTAINGTDIDAATAGAQIIYASLVQGGSVVATVPVSSTGTYSFSNVSPGSYTVVLHTSVGGSTTPALPVAGNGWVNTGEFVGAGTGNDGSANGILAVIVTAGLNVTNANMGIQQPPFAGNGAQSGANPGSTNPVVVNASTFTNGLITTDVSPGTITSIRITAIPTGATTIAINGTTYGPGFTAFPAAGVDVPTDATGNPTQTISVDPTAAGATTVTILFKAIDNAGTVSNNTGNAVINLISVSISGTVYDDANALSDLPTGIVNGTAINGLDIDPTASGNQALFASLIQSGSIIATVPVSNVGTYTFADVPTGTYTVVLHNIASGSLVSTLPTAGNGWLNTGENISASAGNDGAANGELSVAMAGVSVTDANFGIQQPPTAGSGSNTTTNPGGTISVTVPASTFTNSSISADPDGTVTSVKITSFPVGANSLSIGTVTYYANAGAIPGVCPTASCLAFPGAGIILATDNAGNPSAAIKADPSSLGVTTIDIPFVSIDNAGSESGITGHAIMNFTDLLISGIVYHDADGGTISGTPANIIGTNTLYMNLVDGSNHVVASVPVNVDGTYSFGTQNGITASTSYLLILSATQGTQGNNPPSNSLVNVANTAEGTVAAGDGTPNGFVGVSLGVTSISSVNFAVEELPTAGSGSNTVVNPGGTTQVSIPLSTFINISATTDPDGTVPNIRITSFPTNATSVVINGTTYTVAGGSGTTIWPGAGVITPVTSLGSVDPNFNGAGQVVFSFKAIDNAGKESGNIGTATLNFLAPTVTVSGSVWDDASANAVKDGGEIAILNGSVWVNLVDPSSNDVVQSVQVDGAGNYTFTGVAQSTNYSIILSVADETGNTNLSVGTVPTGFINTGVNLNSSANTANTTGIINLNTGTSNSTAQNFGIQQIPIVGGGSNNAVNPGGLISVNVPASTFTNTSASDDIDGTVTSIKITSFPTDATSLTIGTTTYYPTVGAIPGVCPTASCLAFPAAGVIVPTDGDGNPATSIFADPLATGSTTVKIPFVAIDNAGSESAIGFATMNFAAPGTIIISGNVWDDGDGNAINDNGENKITDGSVWVNLINPATDDVIQSVQVDGSGNYSFTGVTPNANYTIILSNSNEAGNINLTSASLPVGLVSTGVNLDATANTSNKTAIISISAGIVSISNQDFGVEQLPIATTYLANSQVNPGGSTSVNVISTNFSGTDADGIISSIKITGFPTNATSISIGTATYYPTAGDIPSVCPTTSCLVFPAEGITTTTNASGNPIAAINIDPLDGTVNVVIPYKTIDNAGQESTLEANVILPFTAPVSLPPVAQNINNPAINNSAAQSHIGGLVASDPQGDPINSFTVLTIPSATEGVLYTCSNNTVPCTGSFAAVIANQVLTPAQAAALYFDPANTFTGTSVFTYNATSINGSSNTATVSIPVVNNPPTANSFTTAPVAQNSSNNLLPALTGADGDGTVVSYTVAPSNAAEGSITYCTNPPGSGCGTAIAAQTVLTPAQISSINFTPANGFLGNATFTYIVTDNNGNTSTQATVTVPVTTTGGVLINLPPVTQNVTIEPLNSNAAATPISALVGSDPDGTIANYTIITIPSASVGVLYYCTTGNYPCTGALTAVTNGATLTSAQANTLQFDPEADNNSSTTFTYTATDNLGLISNTSSYIIPIENQAPTAIAIHATVPYKSTNSAVPVLQGNDVDGTISSFTVTSVPNTATEGELFYCTTGTLPTCTPIVLSNGTILTATQAATLTFTPVSGFTGTAAGAYTATDNNGKTSQAASIVIDVENYSYAGQPPVANGSSFNIGGNAGNTSLPVNFITGVDPDGTVASYAVTSLPPVSHGVFTYCTAPPSANCGTLLNLGDVLTPAQAATISFTPTATYAGPAYLGFTVMDNSGNLSNIANSVVNIENEPPIATGYTTATVKNGGSVINTPLQATDLMDGGSIASFSITSVPTTNNGTLTYCAGGVPGCASPTTIIVGTTLTPAEAATVRYIPGILMAVSEVPFTFTATDNSGNLSNVATIVIPVTIIPDLTPIIRLPNNSFTSTGTGAELLMVGELVSLINISTTTGSTKFSITAPVGYTISFDPAITSIDVSGGTGTTLVQNPSWTLLSTQLGGRRLNFQAKEGIFIRGLLKAELGFKIKRTTSFQGSQPVVTINIADDSTIQYDSVTPNNIFTRILNSL